MSDTDLDDLGAEATISVDLAATRNELRMMSQLHFKMHASSSLDSQFNNGMGNFLNQLAERLDQVAKRYSRERASFVRNIKELTSHVP